MIANTETALLITLIGMGLVFTAFIILWLAISSLVAVASKIQYARKDEPENVIESDLKRRAAIAAVVVALARQKDPELHEFPLPPTAFVSAWQAVMRSNIIKKRGQVR
jgi:Na+-transporting methylmalonyl-CoA/oxaloacetate decarboxylase gamma subunit